MIPIITPELMHEEESHWEIQDPIKRVETAAGALFEALISYTHPNDHLLFIVGKGLNGADAMCLAELCIEAGFKVSVMPLFPIADFKKETLQFFERLKNLDVIRSFALPASGRYMIIDGVFGAGFKDTLSDDIKTIFDLINGTNFYKIAIDIPSGIHGADGSGDSAIMADVTLSVGMPKWGLFVKKGRYHSGHIHHVDIGLKNQIASKKALGFFLTPQSLVGRYPKEKPHFHKYQRGQVIALASSVSYKGASYLCTKAAYRTGAGMVRLLHEKGSAYFNDLTPEVTQHDLSDLDKFIEKKPSSFILGPGLVPSSSESGMINKILDSRIPCVVDGGAFEVINKHKLHSHVVLTPHIEELKRLLKNNSDDFDQLIKLTSNELLQSGLTVIIKGHHSWILHQDAKPIISAIAPASMATAGSGDVLSGMVSALLSKGCSSLDASILSVGLHSLAGQSACMTHSRKSIIASDIIEAIPDAINQII